jgi:hypothetical protein
MFLCQPVITAVDVLLLLQSFYVGMARSHSEHLLYLQHFCADR